MSNVDNTYFSILFLTLTLLLSEIHVGFTTLKKSLIYSPRDLNSFDKG